MPDEPAEVTSGTAVLPESETANQPSGRRELTRRWALRIGAAGAAAVAVGTGRAVLMPTLTRQGLATPDGMAFPVLDVRRRKYRLRFLDCSISRIYEFRLMSSTQGPRAAVTLGYQGNELQGRYRIQDARQCMRFTRIATDGGLLPAPIVRDSFELWPAKRREFVVDFTQYLDGSPTRKGDVVYLTNVMKMLDGRMWNNSTRFVPDPNYKIPMIKIVIGADADDASQVPARMRDLPPFPANWQNMLDDRLIFEVQRGSAGVEIEWLINGKQFDPQNPLVSLQNPAGHKHPATPKEGSFNLWEIRNGGGGWVHPVHLHMEEHAPSCATARSSSTVVTPAARTTCPAKTWRHSTRANP